VVLELFRQRTFAEFKHPMTGPDVALIITSLSTLMGVLGGIWVQVRGQNEARIDRHALALKVDGQTENVKKIELATNSMKDALVKATGEAARAQGLAEGRLAGATEEKARGTPPPPPDEPPDPPEAI
jgi:hypothetical protein